MKRALCCTLACLGLLLAGFLTGGRGAPVDLSRIQGFAALAAFLLPRTYLRAVAPGVQTGPLLVAAVLVSLLALAAAGAIHDVLVDLRPDSATYLQAYGTELSAGNRHALYIPVGFGHGFQALSDDAEVLYMIDRPYVAGSARGLRWNDPSLDVAWPEPVTVIAARDLAYPDWVR